MLLFWSYCQGNCKWRKGICCNANIVLLCLVQDFDGSSTEVYMRCTAEAKYNTNCLHCSNFYISIILKKKPQRIEIFSDVWFYLFAVGLQIVFKDDWTPLVWWQCAWVEGKDSHCGDLCHLHVWSKTYNPQTAQVLGVIIIVAPCHPSDPPRKTMQLWNSTPEHTPFLP